MDPMDHVRHLAETIGPRGSTTREETEAALYAEGILKQVGLTPHTEPFTSARSGWYPSALFAGLQFTGMLLFLFGGQWGAAVASILATFSLASMLLEMVFRPNPLRWMLPKGRSQNVWARIPPRAAPREQVVLLGHLDTHRTPLIFSTDRWLKLFTILVPVGFVSSVVLLLLFVTGAFIGAGPWRLVSLPFALSIIGILLLTLQADRTPYTAGANDNATGAGIVLGAAERLQAEPLNHTSVWAVLSGCEEVGCYGADAFARAHKRELGGAAWITLDTMGSAGGAPCYLTQETFLLTARSDPGLIGMAEEVAGRRPELNARAHGDYRGLYTEGSIGAKHGFRVLTLMALTPEGKLTELHRPTDLVGNLDPSVVEASAALLWELLQAIDQRAGEEE